MNCCHLSMEKFQDIDFIKHENKEPNLFLPEEDTEIPMFLNNNRKETA